MTAGLQVSRLINIVINLQPNAAQFPSVTSAMFVGSSNVINVDERYRSYTTLLEVADDFGTAVPEYYAAELFFGQNPRPEQLYIGRWAQAATAGLLIGGILTSTQQEISNWDGIADGSFHITVDGNAAVSVTACDFTALGSPNLNAVATEINTRLSAAAAGATCAWNGEQFTFTSDTTGASSSVVYLTAGAGGTDIHTQLAGTAATGATEVNGIVAESALESVEILDSLPVSLYMLMFASTYLVDADNEAIAAYIEGDAIPHIYGITTQNTEAIDPNSTADIGYILQQLDYQRSCCQYSSTNAYAIASMLGRAATIDFETANSTIAMMYKQEPGVVPELLTSSQASALDAKNYSYYATFNNGVAIIVNGTMANGFYFDEIQGSDWMVAQVQTDLFNVLFQTPTKIPQTDAGVHVLTTTVAGSLNVGVANGLIGPGTWTYTPVGNLATGTYLETGYYIFAPSVATQSSADRQARKAPTIQAAVIFAGAVQKVGVIINVQR